MNEAYSCDDSYYPTDCTYTYEPDTDYCYYDNTMSYPVEYEGMTHYQTEDNDPQYAVMPPPQETDTTNEQNFHLESKLKKQK